MALVDCGFAGHRDQLPDDRGCDYVLIGGYALGIHGVLRTSVDGHSLRVIGLRELRKNKTASGRPKDRDDLRRLKAEVSTKVEQDPLSAPTVASQQTT
jgi:hypothetical protein